MGFLTVSMTILAAVLSFITLMINIRLLYSIFISKKLKRSTSLTLFYFRFMIDVSLGLSGLFEMSITFCHYIFPENLVNAPSVLIFLISWSTINIVNIRVFLSFIITLDRMFAVFSPIFYYNFRQKASNFFLIALTFSWCSVDNYVIWVSCAYEIFVPPRCVTLACIVNTCFVTYELYYEMLSHMLIGSISLALAIRLFIWNNCKKKSKKKDLDRANLLALIDTIIIFVFDVFPASLITRFQFSTLDVGIGMTLAKMSGLTIEGFCDLSLNRKKSKKLQKSSSLTLFYLRFGVDGFVGVGTLTIMFISFLKLFNVFEITSSYQTFVFFIEWTTVNLASIRVFLVVIITFDRTFAIFSPISYHNSRTKISNTLVIFAVFCYPMLDNTVLWLICRFDLKFPAGCVSFGCLANECFFHYSMSHEIVNGHVESLTLIANQLVLIDAFIIFSFDVVPITLVAIFPDFLGDIGAVLALSKASGYSIEGCLVWRTLKRKNTVLSVSKGRTSMQKSKQGELMD
ncbi:hypothetical protein CRE_19007 [Caenorhabditis remanei]|uniref:Uncharacterized protein n=1 Tax=Caenorhabditis remanei TaxID=31234 RepID=E3LL24_CAERE|nr:hypothetical protein CRE_19007 [Caenorhabditis remanei]